MSYSVTTFWSYCYLTEPSLRCTDLSEAAVSTVTMGVSKRGHVPVWRKGTMAVITTTAAPASTTLSTPRLHLSTLTRLPGILPGILLGISRTPGKILHYPALRCSLKKGYVQAPSHPDSEDIITIQHLLQHESFFSSSFPHKMRLINKSGSINSAAGFKCFMWTIKTLLLWFMDPCSAVVLVKWLKRIN